MSCLNFIKHLELFNKRIFLGFVHRSLCQPLTRDTLVSELVIANQILLSECIICMKLGFNHLFFVGICRLRQNVNLGAHAEEIRYTHKLHLPFTNNDLHFVLFPQ